MSSGLLIVTALLYLWAGIFMVLEGKTPMAFVMFTFFLSNLALAYASQ